jgi:hypothetical protein
LVVAALLAAEVVPLAAPDVVLALVAAPVVLAAVVLAVVPAVVVAAPGVIVSKTPPCKEAGPEALATL